MKSVGFPRRLSLGLLAILLCACAANPSYYDPIAINTMGQCTFVQAKESDSFITYNATVTWNEREGKNVPAELVVPKSSKFRPLDGECYVRYAQRIAGGLISKLSLRTGGQVVETTLLSDFPY
jgi:hypothetical protein